MTYTVYGNIPVRDFEISENVLKKFLNVFLKQH